MNVQPRFPKTYCSQCGGEFGPGNSGYSHCEDHRKSSTVRTAFCDLFVRLADNPAVDIIGEPDADDLDELAVHVRRLLQDVEGYLCAVYADAKHRTSGLDLDVNIGGILSDVRGDLVSTLKIAAEQMRAAKQALEFERWFVEF